MDVLPFPTHRAAEPAKANFAGLDLVRALSALGVVLLHAGVPYAEHPMPGLSWPIRDASSRLVDGVFWGLELFIMPVFLVLAGFFAWRTLARRGPAQLLKGRFRRLAVPLCFGVLVVLPIDLYVWLCGWLAEGLIAPVKLRSLKFDQGLDRHLWGLSHLWFLQYLLLYVAVFAAAAAGIRRAPRARRGIPGTAGCAVLLVLAGVLTLWWRPEVVWGFQHAFAPVPSKWLYCFTFFAGGLLLAARDPQLLWLRAVSPRLVAVGAVIAVAAVILGRWHLSGGQSRAASGMLAVLTVLGAWTVTLGGIGLADRWTKAPSGWIGYLSAASFWVYLVHHPVVALVHIDLKWSLPALDPALKTLAAFAISVTWSLLSYEALVRKTAFGAWLGFAGSAPAKRRAAVPRLDPEAAEIGERRRAA